MLQSMMDRYTSRIHHGIGQDTNLHNKNQASDVILVHCPHKIQGMYLPFNQNPKKYLWWDPLLNIFNSAKELLLSLDLLAEICACTLLIYLNYGMLLKIFEFQWEPIFLFHVTVLKRLSLLSPSLREYVVLLYSAQVKGLYLLGFWGVTISGNGEIHACSGGAAKYIVDILGLMEWAIALCLTLKNLPFVKACTHHQ